MAAGKKAFVVYTNWKIWLDGMTAEQKGHWIDWMFDYTNDLNPELPEDQVVRMACLMCKETLKRDLTKYEEKVNRFRQIGKQYQTDNDTKSKPNTAPNTEKNKTEIVGDKDKVKDKVKDKDIHNSVYEENSIKEKPTSRFNPPTLEDIKIYCLERNNLVDAERFYDFYSSKGWMVGKNKMKDWKAAIRTWEKEAGFKNPNEATPQLMTGGFEILSTEMPSATPQEVANDIKAMHLTPLQVSQWLSSYTDDFAQEVRKYL